MSGVEKKFAPEVGKLLPEVEKLAPAALMGAGILSRYVPSILGKMGQWKAILAVLGVLVVLAFTVFRSCSFSLPSIKTTPVQALPSVLRVASSCQKYDPSGVYQCVVEPDSAVLLGGITDGQALTYYVQVDPPDRLTATIDRWRSAGGLVLADTTAFLEIGPSQTVWYANTKTGFHLETGTFASQAGARTFLLRTGLMV